MESGRGGVARVDDSDDGGVDRGVAPAERGAGRAPAPTRADQPVLSLDELLLTSDVVSLHVPLTAGTRYLINRRTLVRMKRSAVLVNTSRGGVVDDEALAWALDERLIAGAGLDVFEDEPRVHPGLVGRDNVCLTPHLGSATRETRTAMAQLAVRNVVDVLGRRPAVTPVNRS